jgi:hypothetical protein
MVVLHDGQATSASFAAAVSRAARVPQCEQKFAPANRRRKQDGQPILASGA